MDKTLLIAGKDIPSGSDFASGVSLNQRNTFITTTEASGDTGNGYHAVNWNRTSALSARSTVLTSVNESGYLDEVVLYFDETFFATQFTKTSTAQIEPAVDTMINGFHYLAQEAIARFDQRKDFSDGRTYGKLVFLYKANPSIYDSVVNASRTAGSALSYPLVASAAAAFRAFAENTAATLVDNTAVYPVLVNCENTNELAHKDNALASWLCGYLDMIDDLKKRPAEKQFVSWVKAGAKSPGGFALFR